MPEVWRHSGRKWREYGVNYREFWEEQCRANAGRAEFRRYYESKFPELRKLSGREWLDRAWKLEPWAYLTDREAAG